MREKLRRFNAFSHRYIMPVFIVVVWLLFFVMVVGGAPLSVCIWQGVMAVIVPIAWLNGYV